VPPWSLPALLLLLLQEPRPTPRAEHDVPYRRAGEVQLALDVYLPEGGARRPALLLVHGGAWMHGDKGDVAELGARLAARGYACFAPEYRLAPANRFPAQIEDCVYAVQFVRERAADYDVDPARVGALGFSAGGHLVALLGVLDEQRDLTADDPVRRHSSRLSCAVPYFAPTLLTREQELDFDTRPPPELFGDAPDSAYAAASPVNHVSADDPPFLLVHGEADRTVPVGHSLLLDEKLRLAGVSSELVVVPGGGHADFLFRNPQGDYWKRTERFLAEHLRPRESR
jgi:acetyl esterase/lipase